MKKYNDFNIYEIVNKDNESRLLINKVIKIFPSHLAYIGIHINTELKREENITTLCSFNDTSYNLIDLYLFKITKNEIYNIRDYFMRLCEG